MQMNGWINIMKTEIYLNCHKSNKNKKKKGIFINYFAKKRLLQYLRLNAKLVFLFFLVFSLQFVFNPLSPNIRIQIPQTNLCTFF